MGKIYTHEVVVSSVLTDWPLEIEQLAGFRAQSLTFARIPAGVTLTANWSGKGIPVTQGVRIEGQNLARIQLTTSGTSSTTILIYVADKEGTLYLVAGIVNVLDGNYALIMPASHAQTVAIYNVAMTNANTEYSQALPANCKKFSIGLRDATGFRLAFVTGKVATPTEPYKTVQPGFEYADDLVEPASLPLYFASAVAGKTAEIIAWS